MMKRKPKRGISLTEVVMSTFLVGLLLVAALRSVSSAAMSWITAAELADGHALAQQLLAEMIVLPYEDPNATSNFGAESGEVLTAGVRSGLDDLDDYRDWTDTPPKANTGTALTGYNSWQRTADVQKVNEEDYSLGADNTSDEGIRLATVTVTSPAGQIITLRAYRTTAGGILQPQGVSQALVTWVGATLQSGAGDAVTGGTALPNHASDD